MCSFPSPCFSISICQSHMRISCHRKRKNFTLQMKTVIDLQQHWRTLRKQGKNSWKQNENRKLDTKATLDNCKGCINLNLRLMTAFTQYVVTEITAIFCLFVKRAVPISWYHYHYSSLQ